MKTTIATIFAALILSTGMATTSFAATAKTQNVTVLNNISAINTIEVHGNVELYVSDGAADEVKVYNQYYAESALVQNTNGVLRISSYKNEKLVVWVTASDLRAISAYDNSEVQSFGDISKIEFDVDLHNNASAKLNLDVYSANITVKDHATADLTGTATKFSLNRNYASTVNQYNFRAEHVNENKMSIPAPVELDELAGI
jgi:hypothetical protein